MSSPDQPAGIIYPPPELRGIVDSTAKYVAKNGAPFEAKLMRDKPKFKFLFPEDPFHSYYKHKVKEIRKSLEQPQEQDQPDPTQLLVDKSNDINGNSNLDSDQPQSHQDSILKHQSNDDEDKSDHHTDRLTGGEHVTTKDETEEDLNQDDHDESNDPSDNGPRVRPKLNEYIQEMTMKLVEPPNLNYLATSAPSFTSLDCDILKLTSQFIAIHGRSFLLELVSREHINSQFDFLKPQHGQFSYMTNLIMQYALIQNPSLDVLEQLDKDSNSRKHVLDKIRMRAEWNKMLEVEKKKKEEAEEKEKILYSQIDWYDFVVVETIDYPPDEVGKYPPTTADQVGTRLLMQQRTEDHNVPEEMEIDMDMESDQEEEDIDKNDEFSIPDPPDVSKVVIRKDYDPKSVTKELPQAGNSYLSPFTNEQVSVNQINTHCTFSLHDPLNIERKKQKLQEKMNDVTVFASGNQIQDSLRNLAERRTDIFGMNDEETAIGHRIGEEEEDKPKDDRLIWDGHKSSLKKRKQN